MKKDQDKSLCRRVNAHLLSLECYVRDPKLVTDLHTKYPEKTYTELQRKTVQTGIVEQLVEVPYEITPVSVASYRESTDYKSNPAQAAAMGALTKRRNLGDVSKIQEVMSKDMTQLQAIKADYERVVASIEDQIKAQQAAQQAQQSQEGGESK